MSIELFFRGDCETIGIGNVILAFDHEKLGCEDDDIPLSALVGLDETETSQVLTVLTVR